MTVIGVDAHKRSHTFVAVDEAGRKLAEKTVESTPAGHASGIDWAVQRFGENLVWSVEDNRSVTHHLERDLLAAAPWVVKRCPPHLMARVRESARERGKSDPIDALAIARAALREPNLPVAVHDPVSFEMRQLVDRREDLVGQRVAVTQRLQWRVHLLDPTAGTPMRLDRPCRRADIARYLRTRDGLTSELARQELEDVEYLSRRIDEVTLRIVRRVDELDTSLMSLNGCAHLTAAKFIAEVADVGRFPSEAAFARYCGVAPLPHWSGSTAGRMHAARGGNRQLNAALHRMAIVQLAHDCPGRTYVQQRRLAGDTPLESVRRLKRRLCRLVYNRLRADRRRWAEGPHRHPTVQPAVVVQSPAWLDVTGLSASLRTERRVLESDGDDSR